MVIPFLLSVCLGYVIATVQWIIKQARDREALRAMTHLDVGPGKFLSPNWPPDPRPRDKPFDPTEMI
jgi:hypothetical protein